MLQQTGNFNNLTATAVQLQPPANCWLPPIPKKKKMFALKGAFVCIFVDTLTLF